MIGSGNLPLVIEFEITSTVLEKRVDDLKEQRQSNPICCFQTADAVSFQICVALETNFNIHLQVLYHVAVHQCIFFTDRESVVLLHVLYEYVT